MTVNRLSAYLARLSNELPQTTLSQSLLQSPGLPKGGPPCLWKLVEGWVALRAAHPDLVTASKIASSIYSDLPIHWRQFWMFRDFTGEAMIMIDNGATAQEAYDYLWKTYVEYWVLYQQATGITLKTGRKQQPVRPKKTYKTRLKHRTENAKCRRYRRLIGRNHWKSNYDNTAGLIEQERKRIAREKKFAWLEEQRLKERWQQEIIAAGTLRKKKTRQQKRQAVKLKPPDKLVA